MRPSDQQGDVGQGQRGGDHRERNYDFIPPDERQRLGVLYVPILRISIIQLEVVLMALQQQLREGGKVRRRRRLRIPPPCSHASPT